jgi:hypothetical protein
MFKFRINSHSDASVANAINFVSLSRAAILTYTDRVPCLSPTFVRSAADNAISVPNLKEFLRDD